MTWFPYEVVQTEGERAVLDVHADARGELVRRELYGKFTEHLGANVYNGIWSQILVNPGFEGAGAFDHGPASGHARKMLERVVGRQRWMRVDGLVDAYKKGIAPFWAEFGKGATYAHVGDAFNSDHCQRIDLTGPAAGVQQPMHLPLHRTGTFQVNLAARAKGIPGLGVSIRKGPKAGKAVTPVVLVGPVGGTWGKYEATLKVRDSAARRDDVYWLRIEAAGKGTLWLDQVLLFPADHVKGFDPDVVRLLKDSKLPLLRFPGGNFVSGYHWKDGVGPVDERPSRPNPAWYGIEYNHVGTDEMMAFCEAVGCEPMICINAGNGTAAEAAAWVEYCNGSTSTKYGALRAKHGHAKPYGVRYWEVGNELYGSWQVGSCDADTYAKRYKTFRSAMLKVDPKIQFIANGHSPRWNATVVKGNPKTVRSLSVHTLLGSGARETRDAKQVFQALMGFPNVYTGILERAAAPIVEAGLPPRVAITELQLFTNVGYLPNNQTLTEALWTAQIINVGIRSQGGVEMITHSALLNHGGGLRKRYERVWASPVHWVHHLYATQSGVRPLRGTYTGPCFDGPAVRGISTARRVALLDAMPLLSADGREVTLIVVNRSAEKDLPAKINLHAFRARGKVRAWTLTAPSFMAVNTVEKPDAVQPVEKEVSAGADGLEYVFPKHSLTALVFRM